MPPNVTNACLAQQHDLLPLYVHEQASGSQLGPCGNSVGELLGLPTRGSQHCCHTTREFTHVTMQGFPRLDGAVLVSTIINALLNI